MDNHPGIRKDHMYKKLGIAALLMATTYKKYIKLQIIYYIFFKL